MVISFIHKETVSVFLLEQLKTRDLNYSFKELNGQGGDTEYYLKGHGDIVIY